MNPWRRRGHRSLCGATKVQRYMSGVWTDDRQCLGETANKKKTTGKRHRKNEKERRWIAKKLTSIREHSGCHEVVSNPRPNRSHIHFHHHQTSRWKAVSRRRRRLPFDSVANGTKLKINQLASRDSTLIRVVAQTCCIQKKTKSTTL